jgi:Trp operon repressor
MPRLLTCQSCGTMYRMRDYEGPTEYDMELIELCQRHLGQASDPNPDSHLSLILRCDEETWAKLGDETQVKKELMQNEIEVREVRDDLKVEALKCFARHASPKQGCIDYEDESKTIGRKIGVPQAHRQYLCHYCPAQAFVTHGIRKKKGMYD